MSRQRSKWAAALLTVAVIAGACSNNAKSTTSPAGNAGTGGGSAQAGTGLFPESSLNKPVREGTPKEGGTITFGVESDILATSPNQNLIQPADVQMANAVFDPIISYGDASDPKFAGKTVTDDTNHRYNQLAETLVSSNNLSTWTLTLRSGVKFSNGKDLTAQEVVDHTKWIMADTSGKCACAQDAQNISDVSATGPLTVVYTLKTPVVDFPDKLAGGGLGWITESSARDGVAPGGVPTIQQLVGTGAFKFKSQDGSDYTLVKNDLYYGRDFHNHDAKLPYLDSIVFKPLADSTTRLQAVQSGGVQIMGTADTSNLVGASKDKALTVQPSEGSSSTILVLKITEPPFGVAAKPGESAQQTAIRALDDPDALKAREAFNLAINRNEINQKYYHGTRVPAYGFIPDSSPWFDPKGQLARFDATKAKSMISALKAKGLKPDVSALCISTPEATGIFQILKQQAINVGVTATLHQVEQAILVQDLLSGGGDIDWNVACFRAPQIADPDGVYNALITGGNTNLVKYSRPKVDKWLNEARQTDNTATRRKLYNQIQEQVAHDVVYIPLLFDYWGNVFSDKVSGLSTPDPSSLGIIRPGELYLKK